MSNIRPGRTTIDLGDDHEAVKKTLGMLAERLGLDGLSELIRWLAETAGGAFDETAVLLEVARDRANGGDEWRTFTMLRDLLPPIALTAQRDPMVRDAAGNIIAVRLPTADGDPLTLTDTARANPAEFEEFAAALGGDEEE